ncbi:DpnII family type II restriction endonuclease [Dehalococcoides mccartyi]|uniref:DpnII family type II restriction endonuclease n=1 Tax=Dehalococcoides mccartyi TaxID=61435 RepID=UPI000750595B|nr:DpnII family type II restriction endonuclease [Dehalococcoides mccartyi]
MADINFYRNNLGIGSIDDILKIITDTLIETNYTYDFFVNWSKVTKNRDTYKYEVALLKSLKNSSQPEADLHNLIIKYPEVVKVIPILLACRDGVIKVLNSLETGLSYKNYNFSKIKYTTQELDDIVHFTKASGLLDMLCKMDSATDYLLGVEVGLDTNARKNRSGIFLETMVTETLKEIKKQNRDLLIIEQKSFEYVEKNYSIKIPYSLRDRKFDYVVIDKNKALNIEVNFYSGTGSKPSEIVSSYSDRNRVLMDAGWKLVWLTDGQGWKKMQRPLHTGIENIDYVINTNLLRRGLLEKIINLT